MLITTELSLQPVLNVCVCVCVCSQVSIFQTLLHSRRTSHKLCVCSSMSLHVTTCDMGVCAYMCVLYHKRLVFLKEKKPRKKKRTSLLFVMWRWYLLSVSALLPHSPLPAWGDSVVQNQLFNQGRIVLLFTHLFILAENRTETLPQRETWSSGVVLVVSCVAHTADSLFLVSEPHLATHIPDDCSSRLHLPC